MGFIPTPGAVRVDIQGLYAGQQIHNIIWCSREAAWTQTEREGLATAIETWFNTTGKGLFNTGYQLTQITVVNQDTQNAPSTVHVLAAPIAGTVATAGDPTNVACCATLRTDFRGRSYRGRMYLGGISSGDVANATQFTTAFIARVISALAALKTAIEALGALWVVVSHFTNKVARAAGLKTEITGAAVDQYIDSQRRRLGQRGV